MDMTSNAFYDQELIHITDYAVLYLKMTSNKQNVTNNNNNTHIYIYYKIDNAMPLMDYKHKQHQHLLKSTPVHGNIMFYHPPPPPPPIHTHTHTHTHTAPIMKLRKNLRNSENIRLQTTATLAMPDCAIWEYTYLYIYTSAYMYIYFNTLSIQLKISGIFSWKMCFMQSVGWCWNTQLALGWNYYYPSFKRVVIKYLSYT